MWNSNNPPFQVYRSKGSLASRSVGTRVMFGFTAELGNVLLDAITFDPPNDLAESSLYYSQALFELLEELLVFITSISRSQVKF